MLLLFPWRRIEHGHWLDIFLGTVCLFLFTLSDATARTWADSAEDQLFCLRLASDAERASLQIPLQRGDDAAYWKAAAKTREDRLQRYLLVLATIAYMADRSNDQGLRVQVLLHAAISASKESKTWPVAMRQTYLCVHAALISADVELDDPTALHEVVENLIRAYTSTPIGPEVEDLPLIHAIREASLSSKADAKELGALAYSRAQSLKAKDPRRASRLLTATAQALSAGDDPSRAYGAAIESIRMVKDIDKPERQRTWWANFPAMYDIVKSLQSKANANHFGEGLLNEIGAPSKTNDTELEFAIYLRLAEMASQEIVTGGKQAQDRYVQMDSTARRAALSDGVSVSFLSSALRSLSSDVADGDRAQNFVWGHDKVAATRDYEDAYKPLFKLLLEQSQIVSLGDIRTTLVQRDKIENWLNKMSRLANVLAGKRQEISNIAFQGLQLHSHDSLSAAAMTGFVRRSSGDATTRENILRFLHYQADYNVAIRNVFNAVFAAGFQDAHSDEKLRETFVSLDIMYNESSKASLEFREYIRSQTADPLRGFILGVPLPVKAFQSLLRNDEALIAILPTETSVLVWAITREAADFQRSDLSRAQLNDLIRRLRGSVLPKQANGALVLGPFDAAASFELYMNTIGMIRPVIGGKKHLFWYSSGDLASTPPSLLIDRKPTQDQISDPSELARLNWVVDRYAVSVLPEIYLFSILREAVPPPAQTYAFIGIGAPLLSSAELQAAHRSRSMELAGGLNGRALSSLPKLAESADELRSLANILGPSNSSLLLGPDASKPNVTKLLQKSADIVSFATHGFVANEILGMPDPSLLLAGAGGESDPLSSLLSAREVSGLNLDTRLVILSACNTATSDGRPRGSSFSGLTQGFAAAGARSLLVSHWPVASMAATELSLATVEKSRRDGVPLAVALQEAMRSFRTNHPEYAHPFYWGPFVLVGDGARSLK